MKKLFLSSMFLAAFFVHSVSANDSTGVLATGGLRLEKSSDVAIVSEKLRISPRQISVDYEMENLSGAPIDTLLVFPLPVLEAPEVLNLPLDVDVDNPENFISFRTTINGVKVEVNKQVKAYKLEEDGSKSKDITEELQEANILLSPLGRDYLDKVAALPKKTLEKLTSEKLLEVFENGKERNYTPLWAIEYSYYSKAHFPPHEKVYIHHEYQPVVGRSLFGDFALNDDFSRWCLDEPTRKAVLKTLSKGPVMEKWTKLLERKQVDYILTTGANWAGPIRYFELTFVKDTPKQIVSVCAEDLKRVSDTEFRLVKHDFTPKENLSVLFFDPHVNSDSPD